MANYSVLRHAAPLGEEAERYGTVRRGFMPVSYTHLSCSF